ncbi:response regulator transcription factor [Paenibacillus stellifer]|uniref:response regulator transcription factor n=1 Tax=Paenibacillus stellifer TaxID=169760 RepID=UPI000A98DFB9|nr:response regulator transcription factor [Paenibacillus stellifer]
MIHLLIVEDVEDVHSILVELFLSEGYNVHSAYDGLEAAKIFREEAIDLVLLDIMLPYKSGDELVKEFRQTSNVPIMMLSAKDLVSTKIDLLRLGADDYLTKPFDLGEVLVRVEALLRRSQPTGAIAGIIRHGPIVLDNEAKRVMLNGEAINLTAKEFALLHLFLQHPAKVFTKANLFESVWQESFYGDESIIKTHLSNLRNKLKQAGLQADYIETIRGIGYRLKKSDEK